MKFEIKEVMKSNDGLHFKRVVRETPTYDEYDNLKKAKIREEIQEKVFDIPDSVADNAKLISLLMSVVKRMYEVMPKTSKAKIKDRDMIEGMIQVFDDTQTLADVQFSKQGGKLVQRIFKRQGDITKIAGSIK